MLDTYLYVVFSAPNHETEFRAVLSLGGCSAAGGPGCPPRGSEGRASESIGIDKDTGRNADIDADVDIDIDVNEDIDVHRFRYRYRCRCSSSALSNQAPLLLRRAADRLAKSTRKEAGLASVQADVRANQTHRLS